jgi:hypothetical protein
MPNEEENMATNKWAILGGIALNVEYTRKYGFDATAAAKVTAKLVAVPPPSLFQDAIQADIAGRIKRLTAGSSSEPTVVTPGITPGRPPLPSPTTGGPGGGAPGDNLENAQDFKPLTLMVEEKAGIEYSLDDGVTPPRAGRVSEDGVLTNQISTRAKSFVITFADGSEPLELVLDEPMEDADGDELDEEIDEYLETWEEYIAEASEDEFEEFEDDAEEDDEPVLSLIIEEKAGKAYTLDDGIAPESTGVVGEDGALVHAVSPGATKVRIQFEDEPEPIEFEIEAEASSASE